MKQSEIAGRTADSSSITETMKSDLLLNRREMLGITGLAGLAALTDIASGAAPQTAEKRPRIACLVTFWGAPGSHADWIIT